jgi:hypothetical protein
MSRVQHRSDRRSRSAAHLFLAPVTRRPMARGIERVLEKVLAVIPNGPIRERQLREDGILLFGFHHVDGSITINLELLRTTVAIHELLHRAFPQWSERTVRIKTRQLLHALSDDAIAVFNRQIVAAIRRAARPAARIASSALARRRCAAPSSDKVGRASRRC